MNTFFRQSDRKVKKVAGFHLNDGWWSRPWEYAWAQEYIANGGVVADMGCGYTFRPFKEALAEYADHVLAVDANPAVLELDKPENVEFVVARFDDLSPIPSDSLDAIFCISVLEETGDPDNYAKILSEFKRVLKPERNMVFTFDVTYDESKPSEPYPGVHVGPLFDAIYRAGLFIPNSIDFAKGDDLVVHKGYNLCCFHLVVVNL